MRRPNPFQWIGYVYGAKLPNHCREWVRNDLTGRFAVPRHLFRSQFSFLPVYLVFLLAFPGQIWIRGAMVLLSVILAFTFSAAYMAQNRARRLQKHGFPPSTQTARRAAEAAAEKSEYESIYLARRAADA